MWTHWFLCLASIVFPISKCLNLQLYVQTESACCRTVFAVASRWTKTRETHLCYIMFQRGITPDQAEPPPPRVSCSSTVHVRNEAFATTSYLWRPIPLLLLTYSGTDAPPCTLTRDLVLLHRSWTGPCASKLRSLRNICCQQSVCFGGSEKVTRGAAGSSQSQDIGLKKTNHTWP